MDENLFFTDDERLVAELLEENWGLAWDDRPTIAYERESYMMNARVGAIFVYTVSHPMSVDTSDYRTLRRYGYVSIKIGTRRRERYYEWGQEVMRILLDNRRAPALRRNGWTYLEITSRRNDNDPSGWYSGTFDVRLVGFHRPIRSPGFGGAVQRPLPPWVDSVGRDPGDCPAPAIEGVPDEGATDPGECARGSVEGTPDEGETDPGECAREGIGGAPEEGATDPGECGRDDVSGEAPAFVEDPCERR